MAGAIKIVRDWLGKQWTKTSGRSRTTNTTAGTWLKANRSLVSGLFLGLVPLLALWFFSPAETSHESQGSPTHSSATENGILLAVIIAAALIILLFWQRQAASAALIGVLGGKRAGSALKSILKSTWDWTKGERAWSLPLHLSGFILLHLAFANLFPVTWHAYYGGGSKFFFLSQALLLMSVALLSIKGGKAKLLALSLLAMLAISTVNWMEESLFWPSEQTADVSPLKVDTVVAPVGKLSPPISVPLNYCMDWTAAKESEREQYDVVTDGVAYEGGYPNGRRAQFRSKVEYPVLIQYELYPMPCRR